MLKLTNTVKITNGHREILIPKSCFPLVNIKRYHRAKREAGEGMRIQTPDRLITLSATAVRCAKFELVSKKIDD